MESTLRGIPANPATIRSANWRDLMAVRQLEEVCFPADSWPLLEIIGVLTMPGVVRIKAVVDEQIVGFAAGDYRRSEDVAWIATIGVLPDHRRRRIGAALLRECEVRLYSALMGHSALLGRSAFPGRSLRVRLCVRASNQPAIHLYQRAGYQQVGVWERYYQDGEDALVLEKKLEPEEH